MGHDDGLSINISGSVKKPDILTVKSGKSYLVRQAEKNNAALQKFFAKSEDNSSVAYVKPDGTIEKQGKSQSTAVSQATSEVLKEAEAKREQAINDIMKRNKCSRHDAEVKYLQNNGMSKSDAEKAVNKQEKVQNSKEKASNPTYDPKTALGFGYRQVLRYLQAAKSCGYALVKADAKTIELANKYHFEIVDGYVKIPKSELEKAAKEIEEKDNLDRREFYKNAACDRCGHNHHGALKKGKETN